MFEGDTTERVQTFINLGILLETTSNLDSAVERLAIANKCLLFALNHRYAELRIMDDALPSSLLDPLEGLSMLSCGKLELEGRSRLPALKGVRGAC